VFVIPGVKHTEHQHLQAGFSMPNNQLVLLVRHLLAHAERL
jgi:hypothetical protein